MKTEILRKESTTHILNANNLFITAPARVLRIGFSSLMDTSYIWT